MNDEAIVPAELLIELRALRRRNAELEQLNAARGQLHSDRSAGPAETCACAVERTWAAATQQFLVEASTLLASSLDYRTTLENAVQLAIKHLADCCVVDMRGEDGSIRRVAMAHRDPAKEAIGWDMAQRFPIDAQAPSGTAYVIRTGRAEVVSDAPAALVEPARQGSLLARALMELGLRSYMVVPLAARERVLGAMTFIFNDSGRQYAVHDLPLAEDLARRVALAVDNARLYQEVQHALRARDEFISVAAHELRTPITTILGRVQLVERRLQEEGVLDGARRARIAPSLQALQEQTVRLDRLVAALLDVSRAQIGQLQIERLPVDVDLLARRIVNDLLATVEQHTLVYAASDGPLVVEGDELRLDQALHNLLSNALKYSPGGGTIRVRTYRQDETVCVSVADHGIGIPEAARPQLFSQFYRAGNASSTFGGMGVGLYVVRQIVELHGGTIDVASVEGEGSTFTMCLPAAGSRAPIIHRAD